MTTLVATTSVRQLQALGTGGQLAISAAGALAALLQHELGAAHAALFAEPQPNPARGEVDWYAPGPGPALPLGRLPPDQTAPLREELDRLCRDIRDLAARLRESVRESDRFLAEMLTLALRLPDEDAIRAQAGRPLLVGWGHELVGDAGTAAPILGWVAATPAHMPILPPPGARPPPRPPVWPWAGAIALSCLLLVAAVWYLLMLRGLSALAADQTCRPDVAGLDALTAWRRADARHADLRSQLAAALDAAGRRRQQCAIAPGSAAAADAGRARARGGQTGRLEIVLAWDDTSDLDLHVVCPTGEELYFYHAQACGGRLDVDANAEGEGFDTAPVENAFWAEPAPGTYRIIVDPFALRGVRQSRFRVSVRRPGQADEVREGVAVADHRRVPVMEVTLP